MSILTTNTDKGRKAIAEEIGRAAKAANPSVIVTVETLALRDRSLYVNINTNTHGLKASIELQPKFPWFLIHWYGVDSPHRLVRSFTDSVNEVHGHKATTSANDLDTLIYKLEECLLDVVEGSAFEVHYR
jgi:hypothetical protein